LLRRSFTIPVIIASCIIPLFIIVLTSQNQKHQIEQFVFRFKNSNKKYLKIKGVAEEDVNRLLTEQETLLDLALKAVIEALRMTPDRYKIIYNSKYDNNDNIFDSSTTPSAMPSSPIPQNYYYNKYSEGILEIAKGFLNILLNQLVDKTLVLAVKGENSSVEGQKTLNN
jgi:hypothetical protein